MKQAPKMYDADGCDIRARHWDDGGDEIKAGDILNVTVSPNLTEPLKHDTGKPRMELLPPEFLLAVAAVLTKGADKYAAGNWAQGKGFDWSRLTGAAMRHITAWQAGEDLDPETGESHLAHACCGMAFLIAHQARALGTDDRVKNGTKAKKNI